MDKNEELQKWLNDDRYVQTKELMALWGISQDAIGHHLRKNNIRPSKSLAMGQRGRFIFYEKKQCLNLGLEEKVKEWREISSDNHYVRASELAKQWGVSSSAVKSFLKSRNILPIKNLTPYGGAGSGNHLFFDKQQCEHARNELKYGSTELNDWRNSDKHITVEKLAEMYNCSIGVVFHHLGKLKIKAEKTIHTGYNKYCFYDKKKAILVMSEYSKMMKNIDDCECNPSLIQIKDLAYAWGMRLNGVRIFLKRQGIKSAIRPCASRAFYDRAECERARPFINQPEQKEVEKVENIGELATATKHQILCETGADDFVWDKVTMKHKIMPVKNYCDERGNFISLFKKDETVSAILEYKNEQKKLLEKCIADKTLVTTTQLAEMWNTDKKGVYNKIYRLKIKPHAKVKLENGNIWHFYKKSDCIESQTVEKVEEKQMELPEPKEQTPDIIPADTIDLFTMSELESELKNRGVELTAEVRAKINASDMPEMQHIAKMLRGNAKTITIRLSVLNDIAAQLLENRIMNALTATESMNYLNENLCQNTYEEKTFKHVQSFLSYALCGTPKFIELYPYQESSIKAPALWSKRQLIDYCNKNKHNHCMCGGEEQSASNVGRKSKYRSDFPDLVEKFARQGATDKSIAEYLGISQDTFYQYIKKYPEMAGALSDGRNANPLSGVNIVSKSSSERYLMQMQMQINDMQKMIEKLVKKLDGVGVVEKKIYMKNSKVDKVIVTETKLK